MSVSPIEISCPHCRRVYKLRIDKDKLARSTSKARCGRCGKRFSLNSRVAAATLAVADTPAVVRETQARTKRKRPRKLTPPPTIVRAERAAAAPEPAEAKEPTAAEGSPPQESTPTAPRPAPDADDATAAAATERSGRVDQTPQDALDGSASPLTGEALERAFDNALADWLGKAASAEAAGATTSQAAAPEGPEAGEAEPPQDRAAEQADAPAQQAPLKVAEPQATEAPMAPGKAAAAEEQVVAEQPPVVETPTAFEETEAAEATPATESEEDQSGPAEDDAASADGTADDSTTDAFEDNIPTIPPIDGYFDPPAPSSVPLSKVVTAVLTREQWLDLAEPDLSVLVPTSTDSVVALEWLLSEESVRE